MSEKQYTVGYFDESVDVDSYVECDGEYLDSSDVVSILNRQQNEIKKLKLGIGKRFEFRVCTNGLYYFYIFDNETGKEYKYLIDDEFLKLLNELNDENKKLQYKLRNCERGRQSYKQDWKGCSSYCDEYKNKIISLKDEVGRLIEENKELKAKVDDKEVAVEVETGKVMEKIFDLIDEKIEHYQKQPHLAVRISTNCEHRQSCLHNQEVNVCNKAKENAYRELKKELLE